MHKLKGFRAVSLSIFATLLLGAGGCELIAGLEDHNLVNAESPDGSTGDGGGDEATGPGFSITSLPPLTLQQGTSAPVTVTIARTDGFSGAINISASGLPAAATGTPLTITSDKTSGALTIAVAASTPQGLTHLSIDGVSADGKTSASTTMDLIVRGPPGALDESFGSKGVVTGLVANAEVFVSAAALDANGNILLAAEVQPKGSSNVVYTLIRLTADGVVDKTFGTNGILSHDFGFTPAGLDVPGLFPLPSGEIQIAGFAPATPNWTEVFARITSAGAFDASYSTDGGVGNGFSAAQNAANSFAIDSTGRLYVTGSVSDAPNDVHLERRLAAGPLDSTFIGSNYVLGTGGSVGVLLAIQTDDKAVTLLNSSSGASTGMSLLRVNTDGTRDTNFGVNGYVAPTGDVNGISARAMKLQPDGKILALGNNATVSSVKLGRYTTTGALDTFGDSGLASENFNVVDFALQSDGKIVTAGVGAAGDAGNEYSVFQVTRLTTGGLPDTTFGNGGTISTDFGAAQGATPSNVLIELDGRIVVIGVDNTAGGGATSDFVVTRYWP